ncbi:HigA family addiction module antitoxin [Enterobacter chuandaensis]|uniref:HigA family addiction module antitoxin n=1 Tax=Enterobacter chuandaensis TaxID=2497875 RepID=UPI0038779717
MQLTIPSLRRTQTPTKRSKPTTPGDVLLYEYLEPLNLKISDLAEMLNVHRNTISALVNNNRKLTADMAIRLAKAFDTTIEFWLNLQLNVDVWEAQTNSRTQEELSRIKTIAEIMAKRKSGQPDVA